MKYKDPFLGEIELKKLGESSRHLMGESIIETIYIDDCGNYYIDSIQEYRKLFYIIGSRWYFLGLPIDTIVGCTATPSIPLQNAFGTAFFKIL